MTPEQIKAVLADAIRDAINATAEAATEAEATEAAAAAVMALVSPKHLRWVYDDGGIYANSPNGVYRIEYGDDGGMHLENAEHKYESNHNSEDAAQAAAQAAADTAWWGQSNLADMIGGE